MSASKNVSSSKSADKKLDLILHKISQKITPDLNVVKDADFVVDKINSILSKKKIHALCVKGGSIAKGTFLKDDYDIDLFVRFDKSYSNKDISSILEPVISELCKSLKTKYDRIHGSRDYYQFTANTLTKIELKKSSNKTNNKANELSFEIIPVIMVHASDEYEANNSTDLSPEHVSWVLKYTSKNQSLTSDIRLAKQFCKSIGVYGAESYINGFSGHTIDIMIIHFGSFKNMIKYFSKLDDKINKPIIIDTDKRLLNPLKQLNRNKITPLIIIDPIQSFRNSSAAVNRNSLIKLITKSRELITNPGEDYFIIKKFDLKQEIKTSLKNLVDSKKIKNSDIKSKLNIVTLNIIPTEGSKDIVGTKVLKYYENLILQLKLNDFIVYGSGWDFNYENKLAQIYIIIAKEISSEIIRRGPPIPKNNAVNEDYKKFVDKHTKLKNKLIYKDNNVSVIIKRKFTDPLQFIKDLTSEDYMGSKIKKVEIQ